MKCRRNWLDVYLIRRHVLKQSIFKIMIFMILILTELKVPLGMTNFGLYMITNDGRSLFFNASSSGPSKAFPYVYSSR